MNQSSVLRESIEDPEAELAAIETALSRLNRIDELRDSVPSIFTPFLKPARYKGAHGGRGGAKSHVFATLLINDCLTRPGLRTVCIREFQVSLEQSVKRLLEDKIRQYGLSDEFRILNTHISTPGDGIIIFNGMQNHTAESIKSLEGYHRAWVEEAQSLSQRSLDLLRPTIRTETCRYCHLDNPKEQCINKGGHLLDPSEIWFSWNPHLPSDPVDKLLRGAPPADAVVIESSYRDNPHFPTVLRREMEWDRNRDVEKYNHVWLGQYERKSEARVFKNWRVEDFETPVTTEFLFGGDWGFSVDPTVLVRGYVDGRTLYVDREVYQVGCEIDHTPTLFDTIENGMARQWSITTDSARPETISYMQRHGYPRIVGAKKGAGSVEEGIQFLKSYDIVVHPRCVHVIDELTMYSFKKHPLTGEIMPALEDKKNHTIDSLRYMVEGVRNPIENWVTW